MVDLTTVVLGPQPDQNFGTLIYSFDGSKGYPNFANPSSIVCRFLSSLFVSPCTDLGISLKLASVFFPRDNRPDSQLPLIDLCSKYTYSDDDADDPNDESHANEILKVIKNRMNFKIKDAEANTIFNGLLALVVETIGDIHRSGTV